MIYATRPQLAEYLTGEVTGVTPSNSVVLLRRASSLVGHAVRGAVYRTYSTGLPINPLLTAALVEATCAQAAAWAANSIDPTAGRAGSTPTVTSKSLGGAAVGFATYAADAAARSDLASGDVLVGEAWRVLDAAGLLSTNVQSGALEGSGIDYQLTPPGMVLGEGTLGT